MMQGLFPYGCPLVMLVTEQRTDGRRLRMSAFGGKADVRELPAVCPLIANKRHSSTIPTAWILRSLVVSLLGEGERAWNADLPY